MQVEQDDGTARTPAVRDSIGHLIRLVFVRFIGEAMQDGPRSREFVVLDVLADQDVDSQQELAERLGINRTIMVRLIDRLQAAGYVTRMRNPANRRSYVLSLTDGGRKELDGMRRAVSDRDARITATLTPPERQRFNELLSRLLPEPEQPTIQSTEYLVAQAHYRLRRDGDAMLADAGLKMRHFGPLSVIAKLGPCPQQQLAQYLSITEPAAAQLVDELVQAGMVERGQDPRDRRRYALELTDLGRERLTVVYDAFDRLQTEVRNTLGEDGDRELRALLTKLVPDEGVPIS